MFVGETGVGRVVKRTLEVMKELGTDDPAGDPPPRCDRPADDSALPELLVHLLAGPVRLGGLVQRRQLVRQRHQGPAGRRRSTRITSAPTRPTSWKRPQGKENVSLRNAMNEVMRDVLHQGLRDRRQALEHADPARRLSTSACPCRARGSGARIGAWANRADRSRTASCRPGGVRSSAARVAAERGRPRVRATA